MRRTPPASEANPPLDPQADATHGRMKAVLRIYALVHALLAALFACATLLLVVIAAKIGWFAFAEGLTRGAAHSAVGDHRLRARRQARCAERHGA